MSYSSIVEGLPEPLRQPNRLAIIASVAFHGVAFAVLPFLPTASTAVNTQRMVNLIELSASEQSRLPQFSASQLPQTGLPPGGLPPLGLGTLPPGLPNYAVDSPISFNPSVPRAQPEFTVVIPVPVRPSQAAQEPDPDPTAARLPGSEALVPQSTPNIPPFNPNQLPDLTAANPAIPSGASPAPFFPSPSPGATEEPSASGASPSPSSQPLAPVPAGPGSEWLVEARQVSNDPALMIQPQAVTLPYPEKLCRTPPKRPIPVQVLALVNPAGKLMTINGSINGLRLIESTGYPSLNDVALDPANYSIRATGEYQAILYSSAFQYSGKDCAATQLNTSPKKTPGSTTPPSPSPVGRSLSPSGPSPSPTTLSPSPTPSVPTSTSSPTSPSPSPQTSEATPSPESPSLNQVAPIPESSELPEAPLPETPELSPSPLPATPETTSPSPEATTPQVTVPEVSPLSPSPSNSN